MKCVVFGATGYTGKALVEIACKQKIEVVAHIRPGSSSLDDMQAHFQQLGASVEVVPWELEPLVELLLRHQPDAVFCLVGTTKSRMKALEKQGKDAENASYMAVDYGLTKLLVDASVEAVQRADTMSAPTFVYLSSMGISTDKAPVGNAYMTARYKAEQAVLHSELPYIIARPAFISGSDREESRPMERVGAVLSDAVLHGLGALGAKKLEKTYRSTTSTELATRLLGLACEEQGSRIVEAADLKMD